MTNSTERGKASATAAAAQLIREQVGAGVQVPVGDLHLAVRHRHGGRLPLGPPLDPLVDGSAVGHVRRAGLCGHQVDPQLQAAGIAW
jgi:hypothetical protein